MKTVTCAVCEAEATVDDEFDNEHGSTYCEDCVNSAFAVLKKEAAKRKQKRLALKREEMN